ncbi:MAG: hypothetical protein IIB33_06910 [Chloroflexi bacterium]|nr:hypothetical protein [Chloroflexota bacterium]
MRSTVQLTPRDLYRLRRARLSLQRATLRAQMAQQELQETTLDLERRYGLLVKVAQLDMQTGVITLDEGAANGYAPLLNSAQEAATHGPSNHADQSPA